MSNNDNTSKKPSFSGYDVPADVNINMFDGSDSVTRRAGGFTPSFAPINTAAISRPSEVSHMSTLQAKTRPEVRPKPRTTTPLIWKLRSVPELPEFHPLERTSVIVENTSSSEVSARISNVLRDRSIEAIYDDDKAKVICTSPEGVDFRVRLYQGRGKYSHGVIVEVQRRFGTSLSFHKDTQAILDAAQGMVPPPPAPTGSNLLPLVSDGEDDSSSQTGSLQMVANMLKYGAYDSNYLAMQTLTPLTDPAKMGAKTALRISTELLRPGNEVGDKIVAMVVDKKADEDDVFKLRVMALNVLANAIETTKGEMSDMLRETLRPSLLRELQQAEKNPRSAQMAARCMEWLIAGDHDVSQVHAALEQALAAGAARHAGLERQAERCLAKIQ